MSILSLLTLIICFSSLCISVSGIDLIYCQATIYSSTNCIGNKYVLYPDPVPLSDIGVQRCFNAGPYSGHDTFSAVTPSGSTWVTTFNLRTYSVNNCQGTYVYTMSATDATETTCVQVVHNPAIPIANRSPDNSVTMKCNITSTTTTTPTTITGPTTTPNPTTGPGSPTTTSPTLGPVGTTSTPTPITGGAFQIPSIYGTLLSMVIVLIISQII